jgi:hypothetical protein
MMLLAASCSQDDLQYTDTAQRYQATTGEGIVIPDEAFNNYLLKLLGKQPGEGITPEEAAKVTTINCPRLNIHSLEGIEYFTNLEELDCSNNSIKAIDLTHNKKLRTLEGFDNELTSLNVEGLDNLERVMIYRNQLSSFSIKSSSLKQLDCDENELEELDVSSCAALTHLECNLNNLKELDVTHNTKLQDLLCTGNALESLNVSNSPDLQNLQVSSNRLKALDVRQNIALDKLTCNKNQLSSLDVSANTSLRLFHCGGNRLTSLTVTANTALVELECFDNALTTLDVSKNTQLAVLVCDGNEISSLKLENTGLQSIDCSDMKLTTLELHCPNLVELTCDDNPQLKSIDTTGLPLLSLLSCGNTGLTTIDVSHNLLLNRLFCENNQLTTIALEANTELGSLQCFNNALTGTLDISKNLKMFAIQAQGNPLLTKLVMSRAQAHRFSQFNIDNQTEIEYVNSPM